VEKMKRNERMAVMIRMMTESPNQIIPLSRFCTLFDAAKSTISEDVAIAQQAMKHFGLGRVETVTGAAGGVIYRPVMPASAACAFLQGVCDTLSSAERVLPGGYLYMTDIMSQPDIMEKMGAILAAPFYDAAPDFVITVEAAGIPIALMTARALGVPLVIARRNNQPSEGTLVTINYLSTARRMQTMSLARSAVHAGQKALIIDDFMRGGGSVAGMRDLMREFAVTVVGAGVVIASEVPEKKLVDHYKPLLIAEQIDDIQGCARLKVAPWVTETDS